MRSSSSGSRMLKHFDDDGDTQTLTLPTIERSIVELILIPPTTATYYVLGVCTETKRSNAKTVGDDVRTSTQVPFPYKLLSDRSY